MDIDLERGEGGLEQTMEENESSAWTPDSEVLDFEKLFLIRFSEG